MGLQRFPKTIYITREQDGDDTYLFAWDDYVGLKDKEVVGIYKLEAISKIRLTTELE